MTNFIFEELHNKFTISHEDTGMSPADLQNITEILRIMSNVFQAQLPEGEKYKN
jgi:ribosomal protein S15P/S13E